MLLIMAGWLFCGLCFWYALAVLRHRTTDRREQQTAEMQARVEARDAAVIEKQLAEAAKLRRCATQNNNAGRAVVEKFPPQEQGKARDLAAKMVGANPHYVSDAKQIAKAAPATPLVRKSGGGARRRSKPLSTP